MSDGSSQVEDQLSYALQLLQQGTGIDPEQVRTVLLTVQAALQAETRQGKDRVAYLHVHAQVPSSLSHVPGLKNYSSQMCVVHALARSRSCIDTDRASANGLKTESEQGHSCSSTVTSWFGRHS